jgi:cyclopropane fatty-acyl-phospholipid synthase-like methyltransferase
MQSQIVNRGIVDLVPSLREGTNVGLTRFEGTGKTIYDRLEADERLNEFFSMQWSRSSKRLFEAVLNNVNFSNLKHVLDIGGGDGQNALQLAGRYPKLKITMVDKSRAERAARHVEASGLQSQVAVIHSDFLEYAFPKDCDAVLLVHVFELLSLEQNSKLLKKCFDSLPAGGSVLLYSYGYRGLTRRVDTAFLSAYFLAVATGTGMLYERETMEKCARNAGFSKVRHLSQGIPSDHVMLIASK